jgi:hypothetical protein
MYHSLQRTMKIQNLKTMNHRKRNLRPRKCGRRKKQHHQICRYKKSNHPSPYQQDWRMLLRIELERGPVR